MSNYHFHIIQHDISINPQPRLPYGDRRLVVVGETLDVYGPIKPCLTGLHASPHLIQALSYRSGCKHVYVTAVTLGGHIMNDRPSDDKVVANERTCIAMLKPAASSTLFRKIALEIGRKTLRYWPDAPDEYKEYLRKPTQANRVAARRKVKSMDYYSDYRYYCLRLARDITQRTITARILCREVFIDTLSLYRWSVYHRYRWQEKDMLATERSRRIGRVAERYEKALHHFIDNLAFAAMKVTP